MSYPCGKFDHDMTINNGISCIFKVVLFSACLDIRQRANYNDPINYDIIIIIIIYILIIKLTL